MLTQPQLLFPLTSTVTSSLFTYAHSSPLSLAARFYRRHTNHSCYIETADGLFLDRPHTPEVAANTIFYYRYLPKALLTGIMNVKNGFCIGAANDLLSSMMNVRNSEFKFIQGMRIVYNILIFA